MNVTTNNALGQMMPTSMDFFIRPLLLILNLDFNLTCICLALSLMVTDELKEWMGNSMDRQ